MREMQNTEEELNSVVGLTITGWSKVDINYGHSFILLETNQKFGNGKKVNLLIDIANGHLTELWSVCSQIKSYYKDYLYLIIGNIANPNTYKHICDMEIADAVRVGIGGGSRCHTSSKTAIHYPIISLLSTIKDIKDKYNYKVDIIADGGIKNSSDIIKCFCAGADKVMMGSVFAKTLESAGKKFFTDEDKYILPVMDAKIDGIDIDMVERYRSGQTIYSEYRGMSTKDVQIKEGKAAPTYEEGFIENIKVEYMLDELLIEINNSLRSAFSYCNARTLSEFYTTSIFIQNFNNNHNSL